MGNRRILITDDNVEVHKDFKKILIHSQSQNQNKLNSTAAELFGEEDFKFKTDSKIEYELDFATQGEEAYQKVITAQSNNRPYALIFMDMRMPPGWDGLTTIEKIWKVVPLTEIVICTAYSDHSLEEIVAKLGLSERLLFLKKPFDSVEVMQMAIAQTEKWNLEQKNLKYTFDLERLVELRTKQLDQERARIANAAKLAALGEMAGGIAHEINNPLTVIHQNADILNEMIQNNFNKDMALKLTSKIVETTERIAKIIRGLRAFSRTGEGDPFAAVTTGQLIEDTLGICREKFKNNKVKIDVVNPIAMTTIDCKQVQLTQVLLNLLNNSFDSIEKFENKWITLEVIDNQSEIEIIVTDSGPGIPKDVQSKIFQPFFTTKEVGKGTGLGLSISKGIIDAHKGKIELDKAYKNTRFIIRLPKKQIELASIKKAGSF